MPKTEKNTKPKVSIITPSIREDGLDLVRNSLIDQTFTDWEWIVGSPFPVEDALWVEDHYGGGFWSLNRIYNALFKKAEGEIIVTWQDFIWIPPDGLEKLVMAVEKTDGVVSGVGDQYAMLDEYGKPTVKIWNDPRKVMTYGSFYECQPNDIEFNWAGFPKKVAYQVGGFDEELDFLGYGGDQLQFIERVDAVGVKTYLDQTNESFTLRHDRSKFGGQSKWDAHHVLFTGAYERRKKDLMEKGMWPKLTYL